MKIIKNINNNYAIAIDSAGNQIVVSGKGIGFGTVPRGVKDITVINRSYYDVDETYVSMINSIPEEVIEISGEIVDYARDVIDNPISSNIVFTLADHISFCIDRHKKGMNIKLPILYDIQHLFEKEMKVGEYGVKLIREKMRVYLPKEEAAYIALHLINAEEKEKNIEADSDRIVEDITQVVEECYGIRIDRQDFNYSRFVSHIHYLLKRGKTKALVESTNDRLYKTMKEDYEKTYQCSEEVAKYLKNNLSIQLNDEEKLYLMLHINRLCTREDCNQ